MVQMIVFPVLAKSFMLSTIAMAINESKPLVGSSQNNMDGLVMISEAKDKRLISPPEMPFTSNSGFPINESLHLYRFKSSRTELTLFKRSSFVAFLSILSIAWNIKCSLTLSVPMNKSFCCTYPHIEFTFLISSMWVPFIWILPTILSEPLLREFRMLRSVDLPAPLGPSMARTSFGFAMPLTVFNHDMMSLIWLQFNSIYLNADAVEFSVYPNLFLSEFAIFTTWIYTWISRIYLNASKLLAFDYYRFFIWIILTKLIFSHGHLTP